MNYKFVIYSLLHILESILLVFYLIITYPLWNYYKNTLFCNLLIINFTSHILLTFILITSCIWNYLTCCFNNSNREPIKFTILNYIIIVGYYISNIVCIYYLLTNHLNHNLAFISFYELPFILMPSLCFGTLIIMLLLVIITTCTKRNSHNDQYYENTYTPLYDNNT